MRSKSCKICGMASASDLFSAVTGDPVCCICKLKYIGGLPTTPSRIADARSRLGLSHGEHLKQDNAKEACRIIGR